MILNDIQKEADKTASFLYYLKLFSISFKKGCMYMENNINILNDKNNIKNILESFGFNTENIKTEDIMNAFEKAEKIKSLIDIPKIEEKPVKAQNINNNNDFIYAAIPFLNEEYQKSIYIAVKLMELKKAFDMPVISIQSKKPQKSSIERKKELLNVLKSYMSKEDAVKIDNILRFIEMRKLINLKEEILIDRK